MSLQKVFTDGNLVDVNVRMWTGIRRIQPEDLGLDPKTVDDLFVLGSKKLIPADILTGFVTLDKKARWILTSKSYPFAFGSARFVPKKKMPEYVLEMDDVIKEYNTKADDLVEKYDSYRIEMRKEYVHAAHAAFARTKAANKGFDKPWDKYVSEFIARIETFYPDVSEIRGKFSMDYTVFQVALPDVSQASYADIVEDGEKLKLMKDAYEHSLQRKIDSFVTNVVTDLRLKAEEVLTAFCNNLEQDKKIIESSMDSVRKMVIDYEGMDVVGDTKLLEMMKDFKVRLIDGYTAKDLRENFSLKKSAIDELKMLLSIITNKAGIEALLKEYRNRLGMN